MRKATTMLAVLLLLSLGSGARAAKRERLASPPPSKVNAAAKTESKVAAQKQTATHAGATTPEHPTIHKGVTTSAAKSETTLEQPSATPAQTSDAAAYQIPWQSVNGGGGPMASANYSVNSSAGQAAIGYSSSASYQAGVGYWYGVSATTGCSCPFQADYDEDGFLTAIDLGKLIDVLFAGAPEITDPGCPKSRGDFDCDGFPTAIDLGLLIDHLFAGGDPPCDPCSP